jgi:hypothetical protein
LSGTVTPSGGDEGTKFVFTVSYASNVSAGDVYLMVNGERFPMQELDPNDANFSDGKAYFCTAKPGSGVNTYYFACEDASGATNATAARMLVVQEVPLIPLGHLDVALAVLAFLPFVIYFLYVVRKMAKTIERLEEQLKKKEDKSQ